MNIDVRSDGVAYVCDCGASGVLEKDDLHLSGEDFVRKQNITGKCSVCGRMFAVPFEKVTVMDERRKLLENATLVIKSESIVFTGGDEVELEKDIVIDALYNTRIALYVCKNNLTSEYGLVVVNYSNFEINEYALPEDEKFIEGVVFVEITPDKSVLEQRSPFGVIVSFE